MGEGGSKYDEIHLSTYQTTFTLNIPREFTTGKAYILLDMKRDIRVRNTGINVRTIST